MPVGQEFVDRSDLTIDQVKERVDPTQDHDSLQQQQVQGMPLMNMIPFVPEYLPALMAIEIDLFVPEKTVEEREGCPGFTGHEKIDPAQLFTRVLARQPPDI